MPIIQISLVEGRSPQMLRDLIRNVVNATHETLGAPKETIKVILTEVKPTHWGSGDQTIAEKRST